MIGLPAVDERGGAPAVEAAILAVVLAAVIAFVFAAGRVAAAEAAADHAARAAARAVSIARAPEQARPAATQEAVRVFGEQGLACDGLTVDIETEFGSGTSGRGGGPIAVRASVVCAVRWSDLDIPVVSGSHEVRAEFSSPIDRYREIP